MTDVKETITNVQPGNDDTMTIRHNDVFRIEENGHRYHVHSRYRDASDHKRVKLRDRERRHSIYLTPEQIREAVEDGRWVCVSRMD